MPGTLEKQKAAAQELPETSATLCMLCGKTKVKKLMFEKVGVVCEPCAIAVTSQYTSYLMSEA